MRSIPPQMWSAFRASLNKDLKTSQSLPSLWIAVGSGNIGTLPLGHPVCTGHKQTLEPAMPCMAGFVLPLVSSALGTATPAASTGSRGCVCRRRRRGLGSHFLTSGLVCRNQDIRAVWPCLVKPGQRYIACFETLAQLALLQATHSHIGGGRYSFSMPSGTDNSATEASLNKMFTTSWRCNSSCS